MIRIALLIILVLMFALFSKANEGTLVTINFLDRTSRPLSLHWVLFYAFVMGGIAYALFTLPERIKLWYTLYKMKKQRKKMGKQINTVLSAVPKKKPHS